MICNEQLRRKGASFPRTCARCGLGPCSATAEERRPFLTINQLWAALHESLALQSLYAEELNKHDGGQRRTFRSVDEWLSRLRSTGAIH